VIRSYLNDEERPNSSGGGFGRENRRSEDPDLRAAFDELDEFLRGNTRGGGAGESGRDKAGEKSRTGNAGEGRTAGRGAAQNLPPESLRPDFAELGLPFGAGEEECKTAYKRLLKLHHPDRHAGHQGNMEKATRRSARINAAYGRIRLWREGETRI
jgi:DnaJ-domain-containing protein 1